MLLDVLPDMDDAAKDVAVWSTALTLPQMLATPVGGFLLDSFQALGRRSDPESILGFQVIFLLAGAYLSLSVALVRNVKGVS